MVAGACGGNDGFRRASVSGGRVMAGATAARPGETCEYGRRWARVCALAAAVGFCLGFSQLASAQFEPTGAPFVGVPAVPKVPTATSTMGDNDLNAKMVVRADELQYDNVNHRIIATGSVQIYYKRSALEADRVIYEQTAKRLRAEGNARFTEADGKVGHGEIIDLTDGCRAGRPAVHNNPGLRTPPGSKAPPAPRAPRAAPSPGCPAGGVPSALDRGV